MRATALVHNAQAAGEVPPTIRPHDLDRKSHLPVMTPAEADGVRELQQFARCVEVRYFHYPCSTLHTRSRDSLAKRWPPHRRPPPPLGTPEPPEGMPQWRERFRNALYTTLFMGAVLSRAYNEPFYPNGISCADAHADQCRVDLLGRLKGFKQSTTEFCIEPSHRDYLLRFPAYNLNGDHSVLEETFGALEDWFIHSSILQTHDRPMSARFCQGPRHVPAPFGRRWFASHPHSPVSRDGWVVPWPERLSPPFAEAPAHVTASTLWMIMQSIHMFEFLLSCFENVDGEEGRGRPESPRGYGDFNPEIKRTTDIVLFGVFQAEKASTLRRYELSAERPFRARPVGSATHKDPLLDFIDIPVVLEALYLRSGLPNEARWPTGHSLFVPPPPLQIFNFLLAKHFRVILDFPEDRYRDSTNKYIEFNASAAVFANEGVSGTERAKWAAAGGQLLMDIPDDAPILVYEEIPENPRLLPEFERHSSLDSSSTEEWEYQSD